MRSTEHHPDPHFATTLAHGLALLRCFGADAPGLGNKELAQMTGLSKATISRLTYTLLARGLLAYDPQTRLYRLGATALSLGYPLLSCLRIRQVARPLMKQLADDLRGSVSLGMRDRIDMVYIETIRGHDAGTFRPDIGATLPMMRSAMGKAWLAQAPAEEAQPVLEALRLAWPAQWPRIEEALAAAKEELRSRGFCISRGEFREGVHAIAAPMQMRIDGEILVFNCGMLSGRLRNETIEHKAGERLLAMVRQVEAALAAQAA